MDHFKFILFEVHWFTWVCKIMFFIKLEKFRSMVSYYIISVPFASSSSSGPSEDSVHFYCFFFLPALRNRPFHLAFSSSLILSSVYSNVLGPSSESAFQLLHIFIFFITYQFSSGKSLSHIWLFAVPWTAAHQASLSITNSWACSNSC